MDHKMTYNHCSVWSEDYKKMKSISICLCCDWNMEIYGNERYVLFIEENYIHLKISITFSQGLQPREIQLQTYGGYVSFLEKKYVFKF